ncbi:MAG: HAMP domain-containing sensor histidine kinase [Opitutaceae bacterium]
MAARLTTHPSRGHGLPVLMVAMTLMIFGVVVAGVTVGLRRQIRNQILHRESEALYSATMLQRDLLGESGKSAEVGGDDFGLFPIVLRTSRMRGVVAVRVFDAGGGFFDSVPVAVEDEDLSPSMVDRIAATGPVAVFHEDFDLNALFLEGSAGEGLAVSKVPLLEVIIPLDRSADDLRAGLAQYWIDGVSIKAEFDRLDRSLVWQAGLAFASGAVLSLAGLGWAFFRLERANRLLKRRTSELARANAELLLAAKTSAIGSVTSHLIHGLKNPLAGLESLVVPTGNGAGSVSAESLREAVAAARRLRGMVDEVVTILGEEKSTAYYELQVSEVLELVAKRVRARAEGKGVRFEYRGGEKGVLSNREANLVGLILVNLIENAIEASQPGGRVTLEALVYDCEIEFLVEDEGSGLPASVRENLFQPVRSTKEGGSGIGLALSHQLAASLCGRLEWEKGVAPIVTRFKLVVPVAIHAVVKH